MTAQQQLSMRGDSSESPINENGLPFGTENWAGLARSQSVVSRSVAGETLIVPVRGRVGDLASIYTFNATGSLIWKLLESPTTFTEIVNAIAREFDVTREQAEPDAMGFVKELFLVGLVEVPKCVAGTEGPVGREGLAAAGAK